MKNDIKVIADIGDEHGGCTYIIAEVNSIILALSIVHELRRWFGMDIKYSYDLMGLDEMEDLTFKGISVKTEEQTFTFN